MRYFLLSLLMFATTAFSALPEVEIKFIQKPVKVNDKICGIANMTIKDSGKKLGNDTYIVCQDKDGITVQELKLVH